MGSGWEAKSKRRKLKAADHTSPGSMVEKDIMGWIGKAGQMGQRREYMDGIFSSGY